MSERQDSIERRWRRVAFSTVGGFVLAACATQTGAQPGADYNPHSRGYEKVGVLNCVDGPLVLEYSGLLAPRTAKAYILDIVGIGRREKAVRLKIAGDKSSVNVQVAGSGQSLAGKEAGVLAAETPVQIDIAPDATIKLAEAPMQPPDGSLAFTIEAKCS